ncbi:ChbG/HpnK family deacetylase [Pseudomonadota bacterium]
MREANPIRLIVNADDFGLSSEVNKGIIYAHENGIVSSTSLMVRQSAAKEAALLAVEKPNLSIGLHLDLGEWFLRDAVWEPIYQVVDINDKEAVAEEFEKQISQFISLVGRKPTHIDSHQHVHNREALRPISNSLSAKYRVPVRHSENAPKYCGKFYGQSEDGSPRLDWISLDALCQVLRNIDGPAHEICCHPSLGPVENTMYSDERMHELETLCDPVILEVLDESNIEIHNFDDFQFLSTSDSH